MSYSFTNLKGGLKTPRITHTLPTNQSTLVASLTISGYMKDHLDLVSYFIRHSASHLTLKSNPPIYLPTQSKRYQTLVSPFVHAKTKEIFEKKLYRQSVQVYDGSPQTIQAWIDYVVDNLPPGIQIDVDRFEFEPLHVQKQVPVLDTPREPCFEEKVLEKSKELLQKFSSQ